MLLIDEDQIVRRVESGEKIALTMRKHALTPFDYRMEIAEAAFPDTPVSVSVLRNLLFKSCRLALRSPDARSQDFYVSMPAAE